MIPSHRAIESSLMGVPARNSVEPKVKPLLMRRTLGAQQGLEQSQNKLDRIVRVAHCGPMGSKRLDSLADFVRHKYRLRVECLPCRRVVFLEPLTLLSKFQARGWSYMLGSVERHLVCAECGGKSLRIGPAFGD